MFGSLHFDFILTNDYYCMGYVISQNYYAQLNSVYAPLNFKNYSHFMHYSPNVLNKYNVRISEISN